MLISLYFGVVWGLLWGILGGGCFAFRLLSSMDPAVNLMRNALTGGISYLVAYLLFGEMAHGMVGLMVALFIDIPIEVCFRNYLIRRRSRPNG
jgi:hypothetical protein